MWRPMFLEAGGEGVIARSSGCKVLAVEECVQFA